MQLLCGQCGHVQAVDDDTAGAVECSHCGRSVTLPGEYDPSETVANIEPPVDEAEGFAEACRQAVPRKLRLTCPECSKRFSVSARRSGKQARCLACGTKVNVPYPDDEMEFDLPHVEHAGVDLSDTPIDLEVIAEAEPEPIQRADEALVLPRAPVLRRKATLDEQAAALAEAAAEAAAGPAPRPKQAVAAKPPKAKPSKAPPAPARPTKTVELVAAVQTDDDQDLPESSKRIYILIAAGVVLAVAAGLGMHVLGDKDQDETGPVSRPPVQPPPAPVCKVMAAYFDVPPPDPPPGRKYLKVKARIDLAAKAPALEFRANGADVVLSYGLNQAHSLGVVTAQLRRGPVHLIPGRSHELTFLFLVLPDMPASTLTIRGVGSAAVPRIAPPTKAICEVASAYFDVSSKEPPPGKKYLKVTAKILLPAGAPALEFRAAGDDVVLSFGQDKVRSLGLTTQSQPGPVRIEPGQSRELTFLFLVPSDIRTSRLAISGVGAVGVPDISPPGQAVCEVRSARFDVFAVGGYFPAPPGTTYLKTEVRITATDLPVEFSADKQDVTLSLKQGRARFVGLGQDGPLPTVPVPPGPGTVRIEPGRSLDKTFVFLVPAGTSGGTLTVSGLNPVDVSPPAQASANAIDLVGTFAETGPRNLKPLMKDPVIAAVQRARGQRLEVIPRGETFDIKIAAASVRGVAKSIGGGMYQTTLEYGEDKLECTLRLANGRRTLIVYFANEPFHQMTYTRLEP